LESLEDSGADGVKLTAGTETPCATKNMLAM
jgi:hypothetical protein